MTATPRKAKAEHTAQPVGAPSPEGAAPDTGSHTPSTEELQDELQQATERYLRTLADAENLRKRLQREKEQAIKYSTEGMVRELLPIIDGLDHALVAVDKQADPDAIIKGVHLIYRQLLGLLEKEGVHRVATVGELFDPHRHEAIGFVRAQEGQQDGTIVEEIQVGYTMHGRVIRPALVKVAKTADPESQQASDQNRLSPQADPAS